MKKSFLVALVSLLLVASCNKDEDIIIDNTEGDPPQSGIILDYEVLEYTPAPGQYINDVANGSARISSPSQACEYANNRLANSQYVSLGSWGGYIVVKFKEAILNSGGYDFSIGSNAFDTSNEPGIVWVMKDDNLNGLPDDVWYELKGSFFNQEGYQRNFWVTYFKPEAKQATIWTDKDGETGEIEWLGNYHSQDFYYPQWVKEDSYTLYGSILPPQASQNELGIWKNDPFDWGYADNFGEDFIMAGAKNQFKISNAVDKNNAPINLSSIDFIKVQTGVLSTSGWLGEISTEITGFYR